MMSMKTKDYGEELYRFWESLDHSGLIEEFEWDEDDLPRSSVWYSPYVALGQRMGSVEYWLSDGLNLELEVFGYCSMPSTASGLFASNSIFIEIADAIVGYAKQ